MSKKDRIFLEIIVGLVLITAAFYFFVEPPRESTWSAERVDIDSGRRVVMGTFARIISVAVDSNTAKSCIETAFAETTRVDELMSDYKNDSEISEVNRDGFKRAVKVSESTYKVLERSVEFSKRTGGAFDVTVGPLVDLWHLAETANVLPSKAELQRACSKVGYDKLILDANEMSVRFAVEGMRLDLGAIGKGYAIDRAVEAMQKAGALGGMVEIGGDIRCFGSPPAGKERWRIGLQDSRRIDEDISEGKVLLVLELTDAAVATSGNYQRFTVIQGQRYSHILDAKTGLTSEELTSVTVISQDALEADALATAVSVMGAEKGLALIEKTPQAEAILITSPPEYRLIKTTGAEKFIE
jgi:thiamine biosynthesis lipoprotein